MAASGGHWKGGNFVAAGNTRNVANTRQTDQAIAMWEKVNALFPTDRVQSHIESLRSGRADWFRSVGLLRVAADRHARGSSGRWNPERYEQNLAKLKSIYRESGLAGYMQD